MGIKESQQLKGLQSQRDKLTVQIKLQNTEVNDASSVLGDLRSKHRNIESEIKKLQLADPTVSEHALLRYFEHVLGYDIEAMRKCILGDGRSEQIRAIGSGKLPLIEGHKMIIKNNTVVSIYPPQYK